MAEQMNIYQKLARIRKQVEVIQKNKSGYGYKYVSEDEILAKISVFMDKYGLSLIPNIKQGSTIVSPYTYKKTKTTGKGDIYEENNNEVLVSADMMWSWVDNDNPEERIDVEWALVGQQGDASQAFGSGLTYSNRYFLLKFFNIATPDADPDAFRSKQRAAETAEDKMIAEQIIQSFDETLKEYTKTDEFGYISYTDEGIAFASKIFEVLNEVKDNFTDAYSFNIESVPAERAAVILCQKDNVLYDHNDKFIYSNQWIPLSAKCTIQEKLRLSSILDEKCSGGSIAHINLESNFPNTETAWKMLNKIAQAGVIYFAFNTRINECKNHHGFVGTDHCPVCGEPVFDTYQRIVGYLVPSRAYSKDRFREFNTRQWYSYAEAMSE